MNHLDNSKAIIIFCSHMCMGEGIKPLTTGEWGKLVHTMLALNIVPENLLTFSERDFIEIFNESEQEAQRLMRLLGRSASIAFEISELESKGIHIVTRADPYYPVKINQKLKFKSPPLFYYAGDILLLGKDAIGYVGSRNIKPDDAEFTVNTVKKTVGNNYAVVSGGAKGIDTIATETAINSNGFAVEYLGESMLKRMRIPKMIKAIQDGHLLLLSATAPDAGFSMGNLMARNKFIYAHSCGTVVVCADTKGGTWSGANENLKNSWCPIFCRNKVECDGNQKLIHMGGIPIDENWSGRIEENKAQNVDQSDDSKSDQLSLFDLKQ